MKTSIIKEDGLDIALLGLGLSYGITSDHDIKYFEIDKEVKEKIFNVAKKLSDKDLGHNKFLESIIVWIDIDAPLYFHSQLDTYRIGMTKQSTSTMHTLMKHSIIQDMFEHPLSDEVLKILEDVRLEGNLNKMKSLLPCGFKQRRICCTNYKTLRNIYHQRKNHRLLEWQAFCYELEKQLKYFYFIVK